MADDFVENGFYLGDFQTLLRKTLEPCPESGEELKGKDQLALVEYFFGVPVINRNISNRYGSLCDLFGKEPISHFQVPNGDITTLDQAHSLYEGLSSCTRFDFSRIYTSLNPEEYMDFLNKVARDNFNGHFGYSSKVFNLVDMGVDEDTVRLELHDKFKFSSDKLELTLKWLFFKFTAKATVQFAYDAMKQG